MSKRMPEDMSERMAEDMSETMSDRMSGDMQRMPERKNVRRDCCRMLPVSSIFANSCEEEGMRLT